MTNMNFGKRAPVDQVDAEISRLSAEIESVSKLMVVAPSSMMAEGMAKVTDLVGKKSLLQVERDRIIREFFYGKQVGR